MFFSFSFALLGEDGVSEVLRPANVRCSEVGFTKDVASKLRVSSGSLGGLCKRGISRVVYTMLYALVWLWSPSQSS